MQFVNFLIKPASSLCNMRCRYCFYEDEAANRTMASMGVMSRDTARLLIREALAAVDFNGRISFAFQGGEPTVAGLDFFRFFVEETRRQNTRHIPIDWSIQTNGLAVDDQWAEFFAQNRFLVGVSLDGDKALHDEFRVDAAGRGTWTRVHAAVQRLQKAGAELNLLCVVTKRCAKSAVRVYHALQKTGVRYLQFIPCLDPLGMERGGMPYSLLPEDYGAFLCALFDEWYRDWAAGRYTSVRLFDDYVHLAMGMPAGTCATSGSCGAYFVIEADGSVYPCDFYALDRYLCGNVNKDGIEQTFLSDGMRAFAADFPPEGPLCAGCGVYAFCGGGCRRYRSFYYGKEGYCPNRDFLEYALPFLAKL